jgi:hypothetical protein
MRHPQIENVRVFAVEAIKDYPQHKEQIKEFWSLMLSEIEEGESIQNECDLCIQSITDLITDEDA